MHAQDKVRAWSQPSNANDAPPASAPASAPRPPPALLHVLYACDAVLRAAAQGGRRLRVVFFASMQGIWTGLDESARTQNLKKNSSFLADFLFLFLFLFACLRQIQWTHAHMRALGV